MLKDTTLAGVKLIERRPFHWDERGSFQEIFRHQDLAGTWTGQFVQENQIIAYQNTLRGMHFHSGLTQTKMVEVLEGSIVDVAVCVLRPHPDFGKFHLEVLSPSKGWMLIGPGHAHGFLALKDSVVRYKTTTYYEPEMERRLNWADPNVAIPWYTWVPPRDLVVSKEDMGGGFLNEVAIP